MVHQVEFLENGTRVWTSANHRINSDSLLLARFCRAKNGATVVDLGAGCGILLFALADRIALEWGIAVESNPEACRLMAGAIEQNGQQDILQVFKGDLRAYRPARRAQWVLANPPYYTAGAVSPLAARAAARHQGETRLEDFAATAARCLGQGGRFCVCYPAQAAAALFAALRENGLEPKRVQLVRKQPEAPARLILLEAHRGGGPGLRFEPDLVALEESEQI